MTMIVIVQSSVLVQRWKYCKTKNSSRATVIKRAKNGPRDSQPNETGTVRYFRRAVPIERRWGGDLTGHDFWASEVVGAAAAL